MWSDLSRIGLMFGSWLFPSLFIGGQLAGTGGLHIYYSALYLANKDKLCIQEPVLKRICTHCQRSSETRNETPGLIINSGLKTKQWGWVSVKSCRKSWGNACSQDEDDRQHECRKSLQSQKWLWTVQEVQSFQMDKEEAQLEGSSISSIMIGRQKPPPAVRPGPDLYSLSNSSNPQTHLGWLSDQPHMRPLHLEV